MNDSPDTALATATDSSHPLVQLFWVGLFAAGTALSARLEIPHQPVPYTLQTLMVLLSGAFLGPRNGMVSQMAYIAAGILGAPVFAGGGAGIARILGPSGGYILSFPLAAALVGYLVGRRHSLIQVALSMGAGLAVVFLLGALHLFAFYTHSIVTAFEAGVLIFSWWDLLKLSAASTIYFEMGKRWKRLPPPPGDSGTN
jgi:biotin transport system substrate-specific component